MIGYKLFHQRKDGSLGPVFINRKQRIVPGIIYNAESHRTHGYLYRPGWHICSKKSAPHLSKRNRVWCKVWFANATVHDKPKSQGGRWFIAQQMRIIDVVK